MMAGQGRPVSAGNQVVELCDAMLPGIHGFDICRRVKQSEGTRHIPVVVCTVLSAQALALSLGAVDFLEKPVTEQSLLAVLNRLETMSRA